MTRYALIATLIGTIALLGVVAWQRYAIGSLRAENASLMHSVKSLEMSVQQSAMARDVEKARASRWQDRAATLDATVEAILKGEVQDENLDPRIADYINGLRIED